MIKQMGGNQEMLFINKITKQKKQNPINLSIQGYNKIQTIISLKTVMIRDNCAYCETSIFSQSTYGCLCTPGLFVCAHCSQIECPGCNNKMKRLEFINCQDCFDKYQDWELLDKYSAKFCYKCCLKALKKSAESEKMIKLSYFASYEKPKLLLFLRSFCSKCKKKLRKQEIAQLEDQNQNNKQSLCSDCSEKQINMKSLLKDIKKPSDQIEMERSSPKKQEIQEKKHLSKSELYQFWQKRQNVSAYGLVRCVSCNFSISRSDTNFIMTEQIALCGICINRSKIEENSMAQEKKRKQIKESNKLMKKVIAQNRPESDYFMADRRIKDSQKMKQKKFQQVREVKTEKKSISNSMAESIINKIKTQEKKKEDQRNSEKDESNKNQKLKIEIPQQQSEQKKAEKLNSSQQLVILQESPKNSKPIKKTQSPQLKRSDSESRLQNIKLTLNWAPDNEIIDCSECGLEIQAINSIWEQQANAPFCKCCYSDYLERLRQQMRKREHQKKMKYAPKIMDSEPLKASTDARIGHEILTKTQQKGRSKPKLIQIDDQDKAAKTDRIIFSNTSPNRQKQHLASKLRENSNSKQAQSRENSSNKKSTGSSNKNNYLRQDRAFGEPMQAMPNTKRLDQLNRSNVNLDGPRMQPHSRPAYNYLNQQKYFKRCYKCNNYSYLSNKYLIGQLPVCVQCFGKHSMQKMQKDKLKAT